MSLPEAQTPGGYDYTAFLSPSGNSAERAVEATNADETQTAIVNHGRSSDNRGAAQLGQEGTSAGYNGSSAAMGSNFDQTNVLHTNVRLPPDLQEKTMYPQQTPPRTSSLPYSAPRSDGQVSNADAVEKQVYGTTSNSSDNKVIESSPSVQKNAQGAGIDPKADFVLVFSLPKAEAPSEEWQAAEQEYSRLVRILKDAKFRTAARPGGKNRNERLILVKAVPSLVRAQAQSEK